MPTVITEIKQLYLHCSRRDVLRSLFNLWARWKTVELGSIVSFVSHGRASRVVQYAVYRAIESISDRGQPQMDVSRHFR